MSKKPEDEYDDELDGGYELYRGLYDDDDDEYDDDEYDEEVYAELDRRIEELLLRGQTMIRNFRKNETYDPNVIAETISAAETVLLQHLTKKVAPGWILDGFEVTAKLDAMSPLPIEAKVYISHKNLFGKELAILWGESGSEDTFDFITGLDGFPQGIHLVLKNT